MTAVLAVLAVVLGFFALVASPAPAHAETVEFTGGTVSWGVKDSWRTYIGAAGTTVGDGATISGYNAEGVPLGFDFPIESGTFHTETNTLTLDLGGWVHFQQHWEAYEPGKYALDTKLSDLSLVIGPDGQELRGTNTGYLESDPGGELHSDVDVVLANLDVADTEETSFAEDSTTWTNIPASAGEGLKLYEPGEIIAPVSISYPGPGGMPDLSETFDAPGMPVVDEGSKWLSGSSASRGNAVFTLQPSARGDLVYTFQISPHLGAQLITVQALDAITMQQVGATYTHTMVPTTTWGRYLRTAIDPATDTLLFLTSGDGANADELTLRTLTFDRDSGTFVPGIAGSVASPAGYAIPGVSGLAWNAERQEAAVITASDGGVALVGQLSLLRFQRDGTAWTVHEATIAPTTADGETPSVASNFGDGVNSQVATRQTRENLAPLGDGYVLATAEATFTDSEGALRYIPAQHLSVDGDTVSVSAIAGTGADSTTGTGAQGHREVTAGPEGSVYLHGTGTNTPDYTKVTLTDGVAVADPLVAVSGPESWFGSVLAASMVYDPARHRLWAIDPGRVTDTGLKLVDETGILAEYTAAEFDTTRNGLPALRLGVDGSLYAPIRDSSTSQYGYQRMVFKGLAPGVATQPESVSVELGRDEASRTASFTAQVDAEIAEAYGSDLQWQVLAPGASRFADIAGEVSPTLEVTASPESAGRTYRLKVSNDAGSVVSDEATLTVSYAPRVTLDAQNATVTEGSDAQFVVNSIASPAYAEGGVTWQRRVGGYWQDIAANDENFVVETEGGSSSLTVVDANADQSGSLFRAKLSNSVATSYSRTVTLTARAAPTTPLQIDGGAISWGVKESFRNYVVGPIARGEVTTSEGATPNSDGTYRFPVDDGVYDPQAETTVVDLAGTVRFTGHDGALNLTVTDPELRLDGTGTGTLLADVTSKDMETGQATAYPDVALASLETATGLSTPATGSADTVTLTDVPATLTEAGAPAFAGFYTAGTKLDPLNASFDLGDEVPSETSPVQTSITLILTNPRHAYGQSTRGRVTVTGTGLTPSGQVTLTVDGKSRIATLAGGRATVRLPTLTPGRHRVRVAYAGNSQASPSTTAADVAVTKARPRIALMPAKRTIRRAQRAKVTVMVTLLGTAQLSPAGQIVIRDGTRIIKTTPLRARHHGRIAVRLPRLSRGTHYLSATTGATRLSHRAVSTYRTITVR